MTQAQPWGRGRLGLIWWFTTITQSLNDKPTSSASSTTVFSLPAVKNAFYNYQGLSLKYFCVVSAVSSDCTWKQAMRRYKKKMCLNLSTGSHSPTFCLSHCSTSLRVCKYSKEGTKQQWLYQSIPYHHGYLQNSGFLFSTGMAFLFHSLAFLLEITSNISSHLLLHLRVNNVFVLTETCSPFKQNWAPVFYSAIVVHILKHC